ncbi:fatty acyl-CoA reductase -like, partial [Asbolus verrucosus]
MLFVAHYTFYQQPKIRFLHGPDTAVIYNSVASDINNISWNKFDTYDIDWPLHVRTSMSGTRLNLLQDTLDNIPKGKKKLRNLDWTTRIELTMSDSEIKNFFKDQTIFITGGTGFLGKVLVEKLLRLGDIKKMYILVRPKKGKTTQERFSDYFSNACFDHIQKENLENKVIFIDGDCEMPSLGIASEPEEVLISETTTIIHAAANVKFDQPLQLAAKINVRSTRDVLEIAKKMPRLKAFVYVSTAYSNCPHHHIKEEFYDPPMTCQQLLKLVDDMNDKLLEKITPKLLGQWPNAYVYTKNIAEDLVKTEGQNLPIAIVRPSIVTATIEEPIPGWTDNLYGLAGIVAGAALGILRSLNAKLDNTTAIVPCDYVINMILASAWNIGEERQEHIPIYNYTGSTKNSVTWRDFVQDIEACAWDYPTEKLVWYYTFKIRENPLWHEICVFFLHTVLAYVTDIVLILSGQKPIAVKNYDRMNKLLRLTSYFSMNTWTFNNDNVEKLWEKMSDADKRNFNFNMDNVDWKMYARHSIIGGRIYALKDPLETIPQGKKKIRILKIAHYSLITIFFILSFLSTQERFSDFQPPFKYLRYFKIIPHHFPRSVSITSKKKIDKVTFIDGDCEMPSLGIASEPEKVLINETTTVIQKLSKMDSGHGGDITAADMIIPELEPSEIAKFYSKSTVLITGSTGFLGKMCLEKLLRDCYDLKRIFVLIRPKKGKDVETRFQEVFDGPSMEPLKRKYPNFTNKVTLINGDCSLPDLGLSDEDKETLVAEVNCILHCAATVRFDEKLRNATHINVRAVIDLIRIAKQMKNLKKSCYKAMIYISTAFSNCIRKKIDEVFYEPPITGDKLLSLLDALEDDKLDKITPVIMGDYPNSYVFTKAVAENVVKNEGKSLPIAVFRPSIVIASVKEPVAGWIDNLYGATGVLIGAAVGVLRSLCGRRENIAEMVPADYVVNCALASAWDIATMKSINDNKESKDQHSTREVKFEEEVPVYNFVSSVESAITWDIYTKLAEKHAKQVPTPLLVWHYFFAMRSSRLAHTLAVFFYHTIPAYIIDFLAVCLGRKPMLVKGYQKINKFAEVIAYFSCREWTFTNNNVQALWQRLNKRDKELFEFSMKHFNWDSYFYTYVRGARAYLLKDPMSTLREGRIKYYKLMALHYTLILVL